ncbi:hypothetical protein [Pararobbsia alpina]|uniref:hypothetical protein n=1 Tax=Pararobbsia alpina TaxID=621374 RepID=UPI0039A5FE29
MIFLPIVPPQPRPLVLTTWIVDDFGNEIHVTPFPKLSPSTRCVGVSNGLWNYLVGLNQRAE